MELYSPKELNKTRLGETGCSSIQFFNSPPFHSQLGHLWYPVQHGMPCHFIGHQVIPTQPLPKEP